MEEIVSVLLAGTIGGMISTWANAKLPHWSAGKMFLGCTAMAALVFGGCYLVMGIVSWQRGLTAVSIAALCVGAVGALSKWVTVRYVDRK